MGEKEDREKAEKLAAAKKRVAQLQKKKKAAESKGEKSEVKDKLTKEEDNKDDVPTSESLADGSKPDVGDETGEQIAATASEEQGATALLQSANQDENEFNAAITTSQNAAQSGESRVGPETSEEPELINTKSRPLHGRQPSLSQQSHIRSTSFRHSTGPLSPNSLPISPEGDTAPELYRKQILRLEELEKENKRLAKEAQDAESRWRRTEEELEDLRENSAETTARRSSNVDGDVEVAKLKSEVESLRRQHRQSISVPKRTTSGTGPAGDEADTLRKELEGKDTTISDMQLEISRLRSRLSSQTEGSETHSEQISALQQSLSSAEKRLQAVETELADTKKALARASEKAVLDGSERTSKDTKIRTLERDAQEAISTRDEAVKKAENLEKKIEAMNKLHREAESRNASKLASAEAGARESNMLKAKISTLENDISRLKEARKRAMSGGGGDEGLQELEDETREKLERKIRELEGENFDLKRGVWREKRTELQPPGDAEEFDEVDLSGSGNASRSRSLASPGLQPRHSNFAQVITSGLAAFRGPAASPDQQAGGPRNDSLLEDFDDEDAGFDEAAFAKAQEEEEARKMVEHVREIKKGLKQWMGWRLDLVDARRGGGAGVGVGEIFDV